MNHALALIAAKIVLGGGLVVGLLASPHGVAHAAPVGVDVYAYEVGDDNENGIVEEDESGWSCVDLGDHVCGPGNSNGVPAGKYDVGGVLMDPWPVDPSAWEGDEYVGGYNERPIAAAPPVSAGGVLLRRAGTGAAQYADPFLKSGAHQRVSMLWLSHNRRAEGESSPRTPAGFDSVLGLRRRTTDRSGPQDDVAAFFHDTVTPTDPAVGTHARRYAACCLRGSG